MFMPIIAPAAPFIHIEIYISIDDGELISENDQGNIEWQKNSGIFLILSMDGLR